MILIGIDDTDIVGSPGTNQLARVIIDRLGLGDRDGTITRHQLLDDPRVPYTSRNGSASIVIRSLGAAELPEVISTIRAAMRAWFVEGSDPGLCAAIAAPAAITAFGRRCQQALVTQGEAFGLAAEHGVHLEGLGGTNGGVIGALAAIGLIAEGEDGRVVHLPGWPWPDELRGVTSIDVIRARGVEEVRVAATGERVLEGSVELNKRLRPNWRGGRVVLLVEPAPEGAPFAWRALKPT